MNENVVQKGKDGNVFIIDLCKKLGLPLVTRTTAQILYQHSVDQLDCKPALKKLAHSSLFLASKITEARLNVESFTAASGMHLDYALEIAIIEHIQFKFEIFDIYTLIFDVCKEFNFDTEEKTARLDSLYGDDRLRKVGFFGNGYAVCDVCLALLDRSEIDLITAVYCIKIDLKEVERIKADLFGIEGL